MVQDAHAPMIQRCRYAVKMAEGSIPARKNSHNRCKASTLLRQLSTMLRYLSTLLFDANPIIFHLLASSGRKSDALLCFQMIDIALKLTVRRRLHSFAHPPPPIRLNKFNFCTIQNIYILVFNIKKLTRLLNLLNQQ